MSQIKIPFNTLKPLFDKHADEYLAAAKRVLKSGWYILGTEVEAFENEFAHYVGTKYCVGLNSGLDALTLSLRAMDIGPGDEVIVPANTYIATVLAITENRAIPVFVEPDEFYCIDAEQIEIAITSRTKAILVVHLYGQPCDMGRIMEIANYRGISVIEDCAQSHGAMWGGQMTGSFGIMGCFSFFPTKNLGAFGDAGGIVTNNGHLAKKVRMLRNYGSAKKYYNEIAGVNSRMDELQAALLRVRLQYIDEILDEREKIVTRYLSEIKNPTLQLPKLRANIRHTWHLFVVRTKKRDELADFLLKNDIGTQIHYPVPPHLSEAYRYLAYPKGSFFKSEEIADEILSLPLFSGMTKAMALNVIHLMNNFKEP